MFSNALLTSLGWCFNYGYVIGGVPFYWDTSTNKLVRTKSTFRHVLSVFWFCLALLNALGYVYELKLIKAHKMPYDPIIVFILVIVVLGSCIPLAAFFFIFVNLSEQLEFMNHVIQYCIQFQGKSVS